MIINKILSFFLTMTSRLFLLLTETLGKHGNEMKKIDYRGTSGKKLLVVRRGGVGDLLFITPILREIHRKHPLLQISIMTQKRNFSVFNGFHYVNHIFEHAWPNVFNFLSHDYVVFLDGVIESDPEAVKSNIYDFLSRKYFQIDLPVGEKKPVVYFDVNESKRLVQCMPVLGKERAGKIGIQLLAGSPVRTPSRDFWIGLIDKVLTSLPDAIVCLLVEGNFASYAQTIIENFNDRPLLKERIINFGDCAGGLERLISSIALMDVIVAPDSSVVHFAAGLDIPLVGLYGPFPSDLRIGYYENCGSFDAEVPCAPCFTHGHEPCVKAKNSGDYFSPCFDTLDISKISNFISSSITNKNISDSYCKYKHVLINSSSETSKFRHRILQIFKDVSGFSLPSLSGVEIGCGGDSLLPEAITVDLYFPYTRCGDRAIQLKGDCGKLRWFADGTMDYIYSSHLLEDFSPEKMHEIFLEWMRVLAPLGFMLLLLPDEQRYREYCRKTNSPANNHHQLTNFGEDYIRDFLSGFPALKIITVKKFWEESDSDDYNLFFILQKKL